VGRRKDISGWPVESFLSVGMFCRLQHVRDWALELHGMGELNTGLLLWSLVATYLVFCWY
jgi:hypothetical protein